MAESQQQQEIAWALRKLSERRRIVEHYQQYARGEHKLMVDRTRLRTIFADLFTNFRLNLCSPVIDSLADRLAVQAFTAPGLEAEEEELEKLQEAQEAALPEAEGETTEPTGEQQELTQPPEGETEPGEGGSEEPEEESLAEQTAQRAWELWRRNRMHRRAGQVHATAISAGDAYVIVWPGPAGEATMYPQSPSSVCVEYSEDEPGKITRAAKYWSKPAGADEKSVVFYLTLYYPDRIEKYATAARSRDTAPGATDFVRRDVKGEKWPLPNQYDTVPVFHFANNADLGEYGVSELRDAVPVQDWMNYSVFSLLVGQEYQAFPQRYAVGVELPRDEYDRPYNPFTAGSEQTWVLGSDEEGNVQLGQFDAADLDKMLGVKREIALTMAQVTQTPVHYFQPTTNQVSGESQKTAEQKLDSKCADRQIAFGDVWAEAMTLALKMEGGDPGELEVEWADLKPRHELEAWEIAEKKEALGISKQQIMREFGYTEDQIQQFIEDAKEDALDRTPPQLQQFVAPANPELAEGLEE